MTDSVFRTTALIRTPFLEVDISYADRVVVVRRSGTEFERVDDIDATITAFNNAVPANRRAGFTVLVDMRLAPLRTDPALDPAFERYRTAIETGFERGAVVVASVVGRARAERLGRTARAPMSVTTSLEAAWKILRKR